MIVYRQGDRKLFYSSFGIGFAFISNMKTAVITDDSELIDMLNKMNIARQYRFSFYNESHEPLDIMSMVCSSNPGLLIVDDDFVKPNTSPLLKSIKKVCPRIEIIFIASDSNIDLGREISPLGIRYYDIKPVDSGDLEASLESLLSIKNPS